jgi:predicted TIM-barrel fold metal-dependent hydrolase
VRCKTAAQVALSDTYPPEGLGDNDITLTKSSPAHMQPIIKAFPETIFVLLHSSYPYTRDAGYLTSVYKNVYLDFGEIFPFISADAQRTVVRQVLELAPTNKILWSSSSAVYLSPYTLLTVPQLTRRGGRKGSTLPLHKLAR